MSDSFSSEQLPSSYHWLPPLIESAAASNQRRLLLVSGESNWCQPVAEQIIEQTQLECRWVGGRVKGEGETWEASQLLGDECQLLVINAHSGFSANSLGAASGALKGGGLLLLLAPPRDQWASFPDPDYRSIGVEISADTECHSGFLQRLADVTGQFSGLNEYSQTRGFMSPGFTAQGLTGSSSDSASSISSSAGQFDGSQQRELIDAIVSMVVNHRRRPVVVTADRGRGKSAALGMAAAALMRGSDRHIVVTGPRSTAVNTLFRHAAEALGLPFAGERFIEVDGAWLRFMAPDQLLEEAPEASLVLVDEAAGIPTPLLERLLQRHPRIVFASTVHGYEGTGRGFALRFFKILERETPKWRQLPLTHPVRWADDDPLEAWINEALLLDAAPLDSDAVNAFSTDKLVGKELSRDQLLRTPSLLSQLFGLLVQAHYRTTPQDLRYLLDSPDVRVFALTQGESVVATALLVLEGPIDEGLLEPIWRGQRRPRGDLIPQTLLAQGGHREAATLAGARVMRIAVLPALQGQGLGQRLISVVLEACESSSIDYLGSSFGATADLVRFWKQCGLEPVRLGTRRDASSGEQSALVMRPISESAESLYGQLRDQYHRDLPIQLLAQGEGVEPSLVVEMLRGRVHRAVSQHDLTEVEAFGRGYRPYEASQASLWRWLIDWSGGAPGAGSNASLDELKIGLMIRSILLGWDWQKLAAEYCLAGRKAVEQQLREAILKTLGE